MKRTTQLANLIKSDEILICPGTYDGLTARLVEQAGFKAIYVSGGAIARSSGYPDIGLLSYNDVIDRLSQIADVTNIPIIADADTGFGNVINVYHTIKQFERAGVSAIHLEDQEFPKRCGHLDNKKLISAEEMVQKIKVAKDVIIDPDFTLIARTDAIAVEGFDAAIDRANQYVEAGADVIFVEAPQTPEQIEKISQQVNAPLLINMFYGGKTPLIPTDKLQEYGYRIIIIPSDLQRAAISAYQKTLKVIMENGDSGKIAKELATFQEREIIIATKEYLALDKT